MNRKILVSIVFICSLLVVSIPLNVFAAGEKADYTFMVYLNGSDLESSPDSFAATSDLKEMMAVGSSSNVNVVLETGGTKEWKTPKISNERNQRWKVEKDDITLIDDSLGNKSMGAQETLEDFVLWNMQNYPADKYVLVFWNHGAGPVYGFGYDELNEDTSLSLPEIKGALNNCYNATGNKFELVGFDACLMATLETANILQDYANYFVASEELEPGHGWDYTPILQSIQQNSTINGGDLGKVIADGFIRQAEAEYTNDAITLSVIDLQKVSNVIEKFESFISKVYVDINQSEKFNFFAKARGKTEDYGYSPSGGSSDTVDIYNLAENTMTNYNDEANALMNAINQAAIYSVKGSAKPNSHGLAIYFPYKDKENFVTNLSIYNSIQFSDVYTTYLNEYVKKLLEEYNPVEFTDNTPELDNSYNNDNPENFYGIDFQESQNSENTTGSYLQIEIKQEDLDQISEIYSVLGMYDEKKENIYYLSMDNDVYLDYETGIIRDNFTGYGTTLNNNFVSMFLTDYDYDTYFYEYAIPAVLNGVDVDLVVVYNDENPYGAVIGAWAVVDENYNIPAKDLIKIKSGDRIKPLYFYENEATLDFGYIEGEEFIVEDQLTLDYAPLPAGEYLYGFYVLDIAQNNSYSDFVNITLNDYQEDINQYLVETSNGYEYVAQAVEEDPEEDPNEIKVNIFGEKLNFPDAKPSIIDNRTMVPLRAIFETLGLTVAWDEATQTIIGTNGTTEIILQIGSKYAFVNGETVELDVGAMIIDDRTYVPVRFIAESTGYKVDWDSDTKTVYITEYLI